MMGLAMSRGSFRILDRMYTRQRANPKSMNVLLYGAEDAGEIALRWLLQNPDLGYLPVGFLDDDQFNWGKRIHGVTILGGGEFIESTIKNKHIDGVIFTSPILLSTEPARKVQEICRTKGVWVRVLKLDFALVE
jgi:FlaA1/EpsC-like NDP-sugar epimerase